LIRECLSAIPGRRKAQAKQSFATKCVPKQELGNERVWLTGAGAQVENAVPPRTAGTEARPTELFPYKPVLKKVISPGRVRLTHQEWCVRRAIRILTIWETILRT
jgi:hypothetical protein